MLHLDGGLAGSRSQYEWFMSEDMVLLPTRSAYWLNSGPAIPSLRIHPFAVPSFASEIVNSPADKNGRIASGLANALHDGSHPEEEHHGIIEP